MSSAAYCNRLRRSVLVSSENRGRFTVSTTPTWKSPAELLPFVLLELSIADASNSIVGASADRLFALEFIEGKIRVSKPRLNSPFRSTLDNRWNADLLIREVITELTGESEENQCVAAPLRFRRARLPFYFRSRKEN